jgi:hypothetical protein
LDNAADLLLWRTVKRLKEGDSGFNPAKELSDLERQRGQFEILEYPLFSKLTFFTRSCELMRSWARGSDSVQNYHDGLKEQISSAYAKTLKDIKNEKETSRRKKMYDNGSDSAILSKNLSIYIPNVRRLCYIES